MTIKNKLGLILILGCFSMPVLAECAQGVFVCVTNNLPANSQATMFTSGEASAGADWPNGSSIPAGGGNLSVRVGMDGSKEAIGNITIDLNMGDGTDGKASIGYSCSDHGMWGKCSCTATPTTSVSGPLSGNQVCMSGSGSFYDGTFISFSVQPAGTSCAKSTECPAPYVNGVGH